MSTDKKKVHHRKQRVRRRNALIRDEKNVEEDKIRKQRDRRKFKKLKEKS